MAAAKAQELLVKYGIDTSVATGLDPTGSQALATAMAEQELHEQRIKLITTEDDTMKDIERRAKNYAALNGFSKDQTIRFVHWALETAKAQDIHFRSLSPQELREACYQLGLMAAPIPRKVIVEATKASGTPSKPIFEKRLTKREKNRLLKRYHERRKA